MKRKRGSGKHKLRLPPVVDANGAAPDIVSQIARDYLDLDDFDNTESDSRRKIGTPQNVSDKSRQLTDSHKQKVVDLTMEPSIYSVPEMNVAVSDNLSKKGKGTMVSSSRGFVSSSDLQFKEKELKAALAVIREVMKMDAAEPFNVPVDPVALAIPDYFDVIDIPMDFGTICSNLESGVKYKGSEDVLRDVQYIWDNCSKYNKKGHYILALMKRVKSTFTKFWTEAGLYREKPEEIQETDGYSHLPCMKSTKRCSTYDEGNPWGSVTYHSRDQQQDQADPCGLHPHQPLSLSCSQSYLPQQRPCQCHLSSSQQQTFQPQAGRNFCSAGHSQLAPPVESSMRPSPRGHRCLVGPFADNPTLPQQNQTGLSQPHHQHQPSLSCSETNQAQLGSYQCPPSFGRQQPSDSFTGNYVINAVNTRHDGAESMIRCNKRGPRYPVGPLTVFVSNLQQDQMPSHAQPQPSSSYGCEHEPPQQTCRSPLSSSRLHPSFGQPQPSQPHAAAEVSSAGHFCTPPPAESMIRCTKRAPRCPAGLMTNYISHHQQDHIAASQTQLHQTSVSCGPPPQTRQGNILGQLSSSQPQPSEQHIDTSSAEGQFYSPPPVESTIKSSKRGPRCLSTLMIDSIGHQQQDQISPSQTQPLQTTVSGGLPHQAQQGNCQGQLSPSQPQPSQQQVGMYMCSSESRSIKKKTRGRGPTRCLKVWNTEGKIPIATDKLGQPIGLEASKLINFLGTLARNGHVAPLNYVDWRAVPDENKEKMWQYVQSKFDIDPTSKIWVLKSIGSKWKNWKANLKSTHYTPHVTNEERLADCDERVLPDQWRILVSFWNSKEAKERSVANKACRAHQKVLHTTGTKSFARVREEQRAKKPDGKEPSRAELFILTRTRKDGRPVNEASSVIISQLREHAAQKQGTSQSCIVEDDVFSQVVGHDRHGRVRTYGLCSSPSDLEGSKPSRGEAIKMASEANVEVHEMKEKMVAMEQTCAQMAAQMATMMSMMSKMQRTLPDKHLQTGASSPSSPLHAEQVACVSGNSEGSRQQQRSAAKRGKQNKNIGKVARRKSARLG